MSDDFTALLSAATTGTEPAGVRELAESLMHAHGLDGWILVFDNAQTRAGQCRPAKREISLSAPLMSLWTPTQREDTIKHEIAHALTPGDPGHGYQWQRMCVTIGADPTRTWGDNGETAIPPKYTGTCPNGHTIQRYRRPKAGGSCIKCSRYYDPRYSFTWTTTETEPS